MNKKFIRIAALILCAVMILGMVPLMAFAAELQPRAITQEDGVYYFETVDDLKELVDVSFPDETWVIYRGEGDLVIDEAIVLPENLQLWCDGYTLRITENGLLDVGGVTCTNLILRGSLYVHGWVDVFATLEVTGQMYLDGGIGVEFAQFDADELSCIVSSSGQDILIDLDVETMEQLKQVFDWAQNYAFPEHNFRIRLELFDVELTENLEIPENCRLQVYHLIIPAGISVTGSGELATVDWIQVYGNLEVKNLDVFDYGGGFVTLEEGSCLSAERISVDAYVPLDMEYLANVLRGVDLSVYDIVDNDGEWELTVRKEETSASGTCGENLTWKLEEGTLTVSGTGKMYAEPSFGKYMEDIRTVVVEEGVTSIGAYAFYEAYNLTQVSLPETLTCISINAFYCTGITEVVIPDNVTEIWDEAFTGNHQLASVTLGENLSLIGLKAFSYAPLTELTIPASVTMIDWNAFGSCAQLTQIKFLGDAPTFSTEVFDTVTATVYYPADNATWTEEVMQDYGGKLTWSAWEANVAGDMSGDGVLDDSDVALLLWHTLFPETYAVSGNADINADSVIDDTDVAYLLWHTLFPDAYPLK